MNDPTKFLLILYILSSMLAGLVLELDRYGVIKFIYYPMILIGRGIKYVSNFILIKWLGLGDDFWKGGY